eukprot:13072095-Alexandrium_andersonii.AAC.1
MSASLVGSEMCIRDRGSGPSTLSGPSGLLRGSESAKVGDPPCCTARSRSCLLYTSDAADDM